MKVFRYLFLILIVYGCSNHTSDNTRSLTLLDKLRTIKVDSLRNIEASWRDRELLIIRYYPEKSKLEYGFPFLLKRATEKGIEFNYQNKWIPVDSIYNHIDIDTIGTSIGQLNYCFESMEKLDIMEINNRIDSNVVYVTIDTLEFYYIFDIKYLNSNKFLRNIKKFEGNWYVEN